MNEKYKLVVIAVIISVVVNLVITQVLPSVHNKAVPFSASYSTSSGEVVDKFITINEIDQERFDNLFDLALAGFTSKDEKTQQEFQSTYNGLVDEINRSMALTKNVDIKPLSRLGGGGGGSCSEVLKNANHTFKS